MGGATNAPLMPTMPPNMLTNWYMFGPHWPMYLGDTPTGVLHMVGIDGYCILGLETGAEPARTRKSILSQGENKGPF